MFLEAISKAVAEEPATPKAPSFKFEMSDEAAEHNWRILKRYGGSLGRALEAQDGTPLDLGSEFRPPAIIGEILGRHPLWARFRSILVNGSIWALKPISETLRIESVEANLARGNHKSANERVEVLRTLLTEDVEHGFSLPVPVSRILEIPGAEVAPMGLAAQSSINERGEIIAKDRPTHDLSFQAAEAESVNARADMDQHQECRFGFVLKRCITYIVDVRRRHPQVPILGNKIDLKAAYRRAHMHPDLAVKSITTVGSLGLVSLRLPFGGRPCPSEFCNISESLADIAAALLACPYWDPANLRSRLQPFVPEPVLLDDDIPFEQALPMVVAIEPNDYGITDAYIDDIPTFVPDLGDNRRRGSGATLLGIDAIERPVAEREPLPRDDLASRKKLTAEGGLAEQMTLLGWFVDTRRMLVSLPDDKFVAWTRSIDERLTAGSATAKDLATMIGRLNHVGYVIPLARHFMSRLRSLEERARHRRSIDIPADVDGDLILWKRFLAKAHEGINMNLLTPRRPTLEYFSDACEHGLGGLALHGRAWRLELPEDLRGRLTLNMLEFLAAFIGPWIDIIEGNMPLLSCALSHLDSTTADGWLHRSNFREHYIDDGTRKRESIVEIGVKRDAARKFASLLLEADVILYSQWFPGKLNVEADSLSRDTHLSVDELTSLLRSSPSCQLPPNFEIRPLPNEISSWILSLARRLPVSKQVSQRLPRSELFRGAGGLPLLTPLASDKTSSSSDSNLGRRTSSSEPSPKPCATEPTLRPSTNDWLNRQSEIPSETFVRPSGKTVIRTLEGMPGDSLASFYSGSSVDIPTPTPARSPRKR